MLKQKGQLIRLLHYLKPYKLIIIIGHILLFMSAGLSMIFPWIVKDIFDTIIRESQWRKLKILILVLIIVFLLRAVVSFLRNYIFSSLAEKITRDLRIDIYNSLIKLSLDYFENHELGDIVSRMTNDLNLVKETMTRGLAALVRQIFVLIIGAVILSRMDYKLTIIIFIVLPLIIFSGNKLGKKIKMISRNVQNRLGLLTSFIEQSLDGINIVKAFLLENYVTGEFELQSEKLMNKSISGIKIKSGLSSLIMFLNSFSILIVMGYGGMRVMQGILTPGELIAFILYVETITGPISTLTILYAELQRTFAAASRIFEIQDTRPGVEEKKNSKKLTQNSSATLEFQNVTFSYTKDDKILKDINFKIKTGEKVALVGPSGAGKSTIAKLLPRFYDIKCGKILIDGINIKNIALTSLRKKIGIVYQDPSLFGISIRDNIACGNINASREEIIEAARKANAHKFITEFKQGYDTQVGRKGTKLSGGQKQRIALARIFLKSPDILILDEATSSLDTITENKVKDALEKLMKEKTTLIIAHRLSTVINADKILVLNNGKIVERGKHKFLIKQRGLYSKLYNQQLLFQKNNSK